MPNTPRGYPYPTGAAPANVPSDMAALANAIDTDVSAVLGSTQLNVKSYGATGNGVTDDTVAIQAALDAAEALVPANGGATVLIPPGKYLITAGTRLIVRQGVTIFAYGAYIFKGGVPTIGILANFALTDSFAAFAGNSQIRIYGGIWDGKAQNAAANSSYDTINFNHCRDIIVQDAVIRNTASFHALEFNSTDGGQAINCRFEGFRDTTAGLTRQFSEAVQIDLAASGSGDIAVFDNTHSTNCTVEGCYMGPAIDGSGLGPFGRLVGSHTTSAGKTYDKITVTNNIINGSLDHAIQAFNWSNSIISGNTISGSGGHGIEVTVPDPGVVGFSVLSTGIIVTGNVITGSATSAIGVDGFTATAGVANIITSDNIIHDIAGNAGVFYNIVGAPSMIANNICTNTANASITANGADQCLIVGNIVKRPVTSYCITVTGTDCLIANNRCDLGTGATAGIRLNTGASKCFVVGNMVRKDGGAQTIAIQCSSGVGLTNTVSQNDLGGFGDVAATITVSSGTINKTVAAGANVGTNLF